MFKESIMRLSRLSKQGTRAPAQLLVAIVCVVLIGSIAAEDKKRDPKVDAAVTKGLDYLAREQHRQGYWEANNGQFRVAMSALSGTAMLSEGSTTTRGKYAPNISRDVDYLTECSQPSGLIGDSNDYHYTYGHGFSMLFLSQVLGEEEDADRRARIKKVLEKAVKFSAEAQTSRGGWGYISAKDGSDFDEGSTCITQVQGLRACRNSGIVVPKEIIEKAKKYIHDCMTPEGGIKYSFNSGGDGSRPPITAAAVAAMYNAGEYGESDDVKKMLTYVHNNIWPGKNGVGGQITDQFGHWHYTHYYFAQVAYRDEKEWEKYRTQISLELLRTQLASGAWNDQQIGHVFATAICTTILQLEKGYLPIYQR